MGDLTRNFSRAEFDKPEAYPPELVDGHLLPLAQLAQWVRDVAGGPGLVTSTFRSSAHNAAVLGASPTSQHPDGDATDLVFPLTPLRAIAQRALEAIDAGQAPAFGQLIFYNVKGHIHISSSAARLGDRNGQVLVCTGADADGRDVFEPLTGAVQVPYLSPTQQANATTAVVLLVLFLIILYFSRPSRAGTSNAQ